jgi:hypothetical protein
MMLVGPVQNLPFAEGRQRLNISDTALFAQQLRQRAASAQPARSIAQSPIHSRPFLETFGQGNRTTVPGRPPAGHFSIDIGPVQDFLNQERPSPHAFHDIALK